MFNARQFDARQYPINGQQQKIQVQREAFFSGVHFDDEKKRSQNERDVKKEMHETTVDRQLVLKQATGDSEKTQPENDFAEFNTRYPDKEIQEAPRKRQHGAEN